MNITDIRIRRTYCENRLRALVSITIDHDLALHDIKIIQGADRLFVAMPSRRDENGEFRDICHPITLPSIVSVPLPDYFSLDQATVSLPQCLLPSLLAYTYL